MNKNKIINYKLQQRINEIIASEIKSLKNIPIIENSNSFDEANSLISSCPGKIVISGMGKAGLIGQKIAATFSSTGTSSCFLHPGEAQHGDLGLLQETDILIVLSTSGKTREVIEMVELSKKLIPDIKVIGITSHKKSKLRKLCDIIIDMGNIIEPCKLGLTPTSSTTTMLVIGDILALLSMEEKKFSKKDYGLRHHGGYLYEKATGKKSRYR